ncbi:hypothetical protein [Streptomyces sp. NPDC001970]
MHRRTFLAAADGATGALAHSAAPAHARVPPQDVETLLTRWFADTYRSLEAMVADSGLPADNIRLGGERPELTDTAYADGGRLMHAFNISSDYGQELTVAERGKPLFGGERLHLPGRGAAMLPLGLTAGRLRIAYATAEISAVSDGRVTFRALGDEAVVAVEGRAALHRRQGLRRGRAHGAAGAAAGVHGVAGLSSAGAGRQRRAGRRHAQRYRANATRSRGMFASNDVCAYIMGCQPCHGSANKQKD